MCFVAVDNSQINDTFTLIVDNFLIFFSAAHSGQLITPKSEHTQILH